MVLWTFPARARTLKRMFVTMVDADVDPDRESDLMAAWEATTGHEPLPPGLVNSTLLRGVDGRWVIVTVWQSKEAVLAMRASGERPAALVMFESAGARPEVSLWQAEGHVTG